MTYQEYTTQKAKLNLITDELSTELNNLATNGFVTEEIRTSENYRNLKTQFNTYFKQLQTLNKFGVKTFKKEIQAERKARRSKFEMSI